MQDGLINFATRVGTLGDKGAFSHYALTILDHFDLEAAYRTSWFRKINDIPPFDEVREWRTWTEADRPDIAKLADEEKRLGIRQKVSEARMLARKDGGAALVIGTGGNAAKPLEPETIDKDGLKYVVVCNRLEITPGEKETDAASPYYGQPKMWRLNNVAMTEVHPSRVIKFVGNPIRQAGYWDGWNGESIWMEIREKVKQSDEIAANISALIAEAKVDVFKVKNFQGQIGTQEYEDAQVARWQAVKLLKSTVNAAIIDADDEFEQKEYAFAGLPDLQDRAMTLLAGIADIPATRLFGRAPQGMNATGDSDMRNYYDRIRAGQVLYLEPAMTILDRSLRGSALGKTSDDEARDGVWYEWNPLYSLTEAEAAAVEKQFADSAKVYADGMLIPNTALAKMVQGGIVERGQWPGAEDAFQEAEDADEEAGLLAEPSEAEQAEEAARVATAKATIANPDPVPRPKPRLVASRDARFTDARPRSLYVRRDVVNKADIRKWAKAQGFESVLDDLHVTIIHSTEPVDWMKMGESWTAKLEIAAGGPRIVDAFGEHKVLLFTSSELRWRHQAALDAGASYAFDEYQPHITITKGPMPEGVEPYQGKIVLGPEIFEEVKEPGTIEHSES